MVMKNYSREEITAIVREEMLKEAPEFESEDITDDTSVYVAINRHNERAFIGRLANKFGMKMKPDDVFPSSREDFPVLDNLTKLFDGRELQRDYPNIDFSQQEDYFPNEIMARETVRAVVSYIERRLEAA